MNFLCKKQNYNAFTLAEVLITLLIIGVVTSLTVPNLINDAQNEEFYTLFKKDYGILNNAVKLMMVDNGGNLAGYFSNSLTMRDKFAQYLVFSKQCVDQEQGCFPNVIKSLHGDEAFGLQAVDATAVINNGGALRFALDSSTCSMNYGTGTPVQNGCGWIHIDVNDFKGPNVMGKDIFAVWVAKTGIYPFGLDSDIISNMSVYCNKDSTDPWSGRGCAAKVLKGDKVD